MQFLKQHVPAPADQGASASALSLWAELKPALDELDAYGGGDDEQVDFVAQGLDELVEVLLTDEVPLNIRRGLLSELLHYIARGHSGLDDALYATAYATCYDEGDLRSLAGHLTALGQEWPLNLARSIYRHLGDD